MVLSITTTKKAHLTINTGAYEQAARHLLYKNISGAPTEYDTASFDAPKRTIRFVSSDKAGSAKVISITLDKAMLLEAWFRQMFPGEFQAVEVAVMATEAQNN